MAQEAIIERIYSDAEREAEALVSAAKRRAEEIVSAASSYAEGVLEETRREAEAQAKSISDGKAATARLDSGKLLLAEKRRVIDTVYARVCEKLLRLDEKETLALTERLLVEYAEEGDEVLFACNYPYFDAAAGLPIVKAKKLKISKERVKLDGGFVLKGETHDCDLSYGALLAYDREARQTELARELFRVKQ